MTTPYQMTTLLYGPGEFVPGSAMTDEEALTYARKNFAHLEFCLVRDWIWVDLDVSESQRLHLAQTQRQPALIYAHSVVYDSACGFHAIRPPSPLSSGQAFHGHLATCSTAIRPGSRSAATQGLHC